MTRRLTQIAAPLQTGSLAARRFAPVTGWVGNPLILKERCFKSGYGDLKPGTLPATVPRVPQTGA